MLWTTGSIIEKCRDSLSKPPAEPVSANLSHWIRNEWIGSADGGASAGTEP
jgi:hypothetical protein